MLLFVVISELTGVESAYEIPDELWDRISSLLPLGKRKKKAGRPRMNDRKAMSAIFYVLRTGCQWNALPRTLGASSSKGVNDANAPTTRQIQYFEMFGNRGIWYKGWKAVTFHGRLPWRWEDIRFALMSQCNYLLWGLLVPTALP